jgi:multiple antibiotic resistance protein
LSATQRAAGREFNQPACFESPMNLLAFTVTLFLVLDPFGNAPVFHLVLSRVPEEKRRAVLARELLIALGILLGFLAVGRHVLSFLGLSPHTLSISGGIVLFLIALGMVFPTRSVLLGDKDDDDPLIVPLAVPLMAGPSSIALLLLTASKQPDKLPAIALAVVAAWWVSAVILWFSPVILRLVGTKGSRAIERLMGLLLILVAVQMFLDGVSVYQQAASGTPAAR